MLQTERQLSLPSFENGAKKSPAIDVRGVLLKGLSPKEFRAVMALLDRIVTREEMDLVTHSSNGPDVVWRLRKKGFPVIMVKKPTVDYDSKPSHYGEYSFDESFKRELLRIIMTPLESSTVH